MNDFLIIYVHYDDLSQNQSNRRTHGTPNPPILFDLLVKTGAETPQKQENATL